MTESLRELFVQSLPCGHWASVVHVALLKRQLQIEPDIGIRLAYLEHIDKMADLALTRAMISAITPMDDKELALWRELVRLDRGRSDCHNSFQYLMDWAGFSAFVQANPSYVEALRLKERDRERNARLFPPIETAGQPAWEPHSVPASLAARETRAQVAKPGFRPW